MIIMKKPEISDFIIWDIYNWSETIKFWEKRINLNDHPFKCLELGCNQGGLSLWLATKGHEVTCSDLQSPEEMAFAYHSSFGIENIRYETINATNIPYQNFFDIIIFKSMLGAASRGGKDENKKIIIKNIHKALKPGGRLLFAENLVASGIHRFFRSRFVKWGQDWNYIKYRDVDELFSPFQEVEYVTAGFLGTFGRNEMQRRFFSQIDKLIIPIIPGKFRYILFGIAKK